MLSMGIIGVIVRTVLNKQIQSLMTFLPLVHTVNTRIQTRNHETTVIRPNYVHREVKHRCPILDSVTFYNCTRGHESFTCALRFPYLV